MANEFGAAEVEFLGARDPMMISRFDENGTEATVSY